MRPASCPRATYQRRQPEQTVLYRTIAAHLPAFLARTAGEDGTGGWPRFVRREFERYLKCGRLEHGLLRVQCERCGETTVVGFSCRGRGFCPSCGGRRMSELAAHLVERVLPRVPIRQWVCTVPVPVRDQLAFDAGLTRAVLRVFLRTVFGWQRRQAVRRGRAGARSGSVTAIQRFGGSANLNVHFHARLFDGVYTRASPTARPVFHRLPPPTDADITSLLARVERRVRRLLIRRGRWPDAEAGSDPFAAQAPLFASAVAASLPGRVALGLRAGQPVRRLRSAAAVTVTGRRSARREGFSLHADVAVPARGGGISWRSCPGTSCGRRWRSTG
jgi:Transposase zinc-binding domain/Putative transposase